VGPGGWPVSPVRGTGLSVSSLRDGSLSLPASARTSSELPAWFGAAPVFRRQAAAVHAIYHAGGANAKNSPADNPAAGCRKRRVDSARGETGLAGESIVRNKANRQGRRPLRLRIADSGDAECQTKPTDTERPGRNRPVVQTKPTVHGRQDGAASLHVRQPVQTKPTWPRHVLAGCTNKANWRSPSAGSGA
jgi:hypothetical protein